MRMVSGILLWKGSMGLGLLFIGLLCLVLLNSCEEKEPEILSIDPRIGRLGDVLTIRGSGFGDERNESYVSIAGIPPTSSSYISWNDEEISVIIPEFGDAGLVYVHRGRGKSNAVLFANEVHIPMFIEGQDTGNGPRISSVEPSSGPIGSLITINGSNFGTSRENSGVYFSWDAEPSAAAQGMNHPDFVEAFEAEFGYEFWNEREIRVRVPDGAVSGNLEVRTSRGNSRPHFFEIAGMPGTKVFLDKRSYSLSYMVDIHIEQASPPNTLYVWMPQPVVSASQRNARLLSRSMEPFVEKHRDTSIFLLADALSRTSREISLSYEVEVYAVETDIRNQNPIRLNRPSPIGTVFTLPSALVPSDDPGIKALAAEIIGRERLPYAKAMLIYRWLISSAGIQAVPLSGGALEALEERQADSYRAALLFCALARAAEVPALPVAGVLVNSNRASTRHYWAEFWLDGFGWIPLDPVLGAGAAPAGFTLREDHAQYYFGNMDNQRIAFSRGEPLLSQMTPRGRMAQRSRDYSLQNLWEEAVGGLESYSSLWSDVTITHMYVQ